MYFKKVTYLGLCLRYKSPPMGGGGNTGGENPGEKRAGSVQEVEKERGRMVSPRWEAGKRGKKDTTLHNILQ